MYTNDLMNALFLFEIVRYILYWSVPFSFFLSLKYFIVWKCQYPFFALKIKFLFKINVEEFFIKIILQRLYSPAKEDSSTFYGPDDPHVYSIVKLVKIFDIAYEYTVSHFVKFADSC